MKKFLLSLMLVCSFAIIKAQTVLNEVYTDPGSGRSEFIELYNGSGVPDNLDCYTILSYWSSGANKGWYVIDLPNHNVAANSWYVLASASPFNVQAQTGVIANANWNGMPTSGYLKKFQQSGGTYNDVTPSMGTVTDLLVDGNFASGANYMIMLFKAGVMVNAFWGGGPSGTLPVGITGMNNLQVIPNPTSCVGSGSFTINFSALGAVEFHNPSGGTDNGYARKFDGKCGSWDKTSSGSSHTPGIANGSAAGAAGSLGTAQSITCATGATWPYAIFNFDITSVSGDVNEANDFPVQVLLYRDVDQSGTFNFGDTLMRSKFVNTVAAPGDTMRFVTSNGGIEEVIVIYKTKRGCFDKVVAFQQACATLPVKLKAFTAARNRSNVLLKWETASEENNRGFDIQRFIGSGNWESVGFVSSKATDGNSSSALNYEFTDINNTKGISQYRLKLLDIDGKSSLSLIRSIRGEGQSGKIILYPNPSSNGKVNVVFEDGNVTRDVTLNDMNGRTIKQWKGMTNNNIQIENLNPGFYTIKISNRETGEQSIEKLIVNKR